MRLLHASSPAQHDGRAVAYLLPELDGVPVGQADAAMRLGARDLPGVGRAVDAVVLLREVDPDDAHGIVRAGLDRRLGVLPFGVPEEPRVVVELRIPEDPRDLPPSGRQRIVPAAGGGRIAREDLAALVEDADRPIVGVDPDLGCRRRYG